MNILLLADTTHPAAAVSDHIKAITQNSEHNWFVENPLKNRILHELDMECFDAVGMHYSIRPHHPYYMPAKLYEAVKAYSGMKFQFLQDEYAQVNTVIDKMVDLNIKLVFTLVKPDIVREAYPDPRLEGTKFVTVLTGYVPKNLVNVNAPPIANRKIDLFYRSRTCPYWFGSLTYEKVEICKKMLELTKDTDFIVDLSVREEDRIYGDDWIKRLCDSRAVLGTESGSSIWDFTGEAEKECNQYMQNHPESSFEQVYNDLLYKYDGNLIYSAISPRVFEAAALKTPMIMFPGWYSGVVEPHKHYIVLEKDFSNIEDVLAKLKDDRLLQELADRTYEDLIASGEYDESQLGKSVDQAFGDMSIVPRVGLSSDIDEKIEDTIHSKKLKNIVLCSFEEVKFIFANFFRLLFDRSLPIHKRIPKLFKGGVRYFVYLFARLSSNKIG